MIRVGMMGGIGSGKSFIAKLFKHPIFNADQEVNKVYRKNKNCYNQLKKRLPKFIKSFPIKKSELIEAVSSNRKNIKIISSIVHPIVRKRMVKFLSQNRNSQMVVLDIPLLIENKLNKKGDILIFIDSKKSDVLKKLTKRKNFNSKLFKKFKKIQLPIDYKKRKAHFIIKNDFTKKSVKIGVNKILNQIA